MCVLTGRVRVWAVIPLVQCVERYSLPTYGKGEARWYEYPLVRPCRAACARSETLTLRGGRSRMGDIHTNWLA